MIVTPKGSMEQWEAGFILFSLRSEAYEKDNKEILIKMVLTYTSMKCIHVLREVKMQAMKTQQQALPLIVNTSISVFLKIAFCHLIL